MNPVYGPVPSWRLGASLGIDPLCAEPKVCTFNCIYCQLGCRARMTRERSVQVATGDVVDGVARSLEGGGPAPDFITFSGTGEPTLALNMGDMVDGIRKLTDLPVAVLTNSSLIADPEVAALLSSLDIVVAKVDAPDEDLFRAINRPVKGISLDAIVDGLRDLRSSMKGGGRFCLQMMFIDANKDRAADMAALARELGPDEVQLNTPLRDCPVSPLPPDAMDAIEALFEGMSTVNVYRSSRPDIPVLDPEGFRKRGRPEK